MEKSLTFLTGKGFEEMKFTASGKVSDGGGQNHGDHNKKPHKPKRIKRNIVDPNGKQTGVHSFNQKGDCCRNAAEPAEEWDGREYSPQCDEYGKKKIYRTCRNSHVKPCQPGNSRFPVFETGGVLCSDLPHHGENQKQIKKNSKDACDDLKRSRLITGKIGRGTF